jgi:iron complex outermembrane receptor protein
MSPPDATDPPIPNAFFIHRIATAFAWALSCGALSLSATAAPSPQASGPVAPPGRSAARTPTAELPARLEEVVVFATPLRRTALESLQPVFVIGGDGLVLARGQSLGDTLAASPGVSATSFGPQASRPVIRGLGGERVQMYQDGGDALDVSALSDDHAVTIEPLLAEQIEVVRGPATLAFGNSASAGLVNVLTGRLPTRRDAPPFAAALELRADEASGERAAAARADGSLGPWRFHGDLHRRSSQELSIPGFAQSAALRERLGVDADATRGVLPDSDGESEGGAGGVSWLGDRGRLGIAASRYDATYGIPGGEAVRIDMGQTRYDLEGEWRMQSGVLDVARLRASWNDYAHAELEPDGAVGTQFAQVGREARLTGEHRPLRGWRGLLGVQWRDVDFDARGEEAFVPPSKTRNLGVYLVEERSVGPLLLEGGLRLEQQKISPAASSGLADYDNDALTASAGASWTLAGATHIALNLTSTERHPTATELYADGPHLAVQRFERGDPTLGTELARTVDLALRRGIAGWQANVSLFLSDYRDFIYPSLTGGIEDDLPVVEFRTTDARFSGAEFELRTPGIESAAGRLSARLFGDYVRAEDGAGEPLPQVPPLRLGAALGLERGPLTLGVEAMWHDAQGRLAANELPTAGFTLLSADLAYRVPAWGRGMLWFIRGSNLLDEDARRHASPLKDRAPLAGRSVSAGVRLEF